MQSKEIPKIGLPDLEHLKECNELDVLYKMFDIINKAKPRTEEILGGNKQAGVDVRKAMQDIKLLSDILRDKIQLRKKTNKNGKDRLIKAIDKEIDRIKKEDLKIKKLENKRKEKVKIN